jgi:hypothetical protein
VNTYPAFAELSLNNIHENGRAGIIVPTGIATDSPNQEFFRYIVENNHLRSLYDFINRKGFFPAVDDRYKFSLLTLAGDNIQKDDFELSFYLEDLDDLQTPKRRFRLSPEEIAILNPNTKTCPTFRTRDAAELTLKIHDGTGILKHQEDGKDWGVGLRRMFHMSDDSHLFKTKNELKNSGWKLEGNIFSKGSEKYVPLYESKLFHQYDHRFATYKGVDGDPDSAKARNVPDTEKDDPKLVILPRYWVPQEEYQEASGANWHLAIRKVTNPTNERTSVCSILPEVATGESLQHILGLDAEESLLMMSCLNSFALDYVARQKLGGMNLSQYIIRQLPAPTPTQFQNVTFDGEPIADVIKNIAMRLMYTSVELQNFAQDADWSEGPYQYGGNERDRNELRFELEALLCHMYNIEVDDFDELFDSFEQIKRSDLNEYGYYRTREHIKEKYREFEGRINSEGKNYE